MWVDKGISQKAGGDLREDIFYLPHPVALSIHKQLDEDSRISSKRNVKMHVAELALDAIGRDTLLSDQPASFKLDRS